MPCRGGYGEPPVQGFHLPPGGRQIAAMTDSRYDYSELDGALSLELLGTDARVAENGRPRDVSSFFQP